MIERYPHTAKIEVTREVDNGTGIPSIETETIDVKGRYEPASQRNDLDKAAKFYCPIIDMDVSQFAGQRLLINGSWIGITQVWNYQTHCEIWLD